MAWDGAGVTRIADDPLQPAEIRCVRRYMETHPEHAARALEDKNAGEVADLLARIPAATAAAVVQRMTAGIATRCLAAQPADRSAAILAELPVESAARLLRMATPSEAAAWLAACPDEVADLLRRVIRHPEGTAGALANPRAVTLPHDLTAGEASLRIKRFPEHLHRDLIVVDQDHRPVGVIDLPALLTSPKTTPVSSLMDRDMKIIPAEMHASAVAVHPAWQHADTVAVVDQSQRFVGVIEHRSVRQRGRETGEASLLAAAHAAIVGVGAVYWSGLTVLLTSLTASPRHPTHDGD